MLCGMNPCVSAGPTACLHSLLSNQYAPLSKHRESRRLHDYEQAVPRAECTEQGAAHWLGVDAGPIPILGSSGGQKRKIKGEKVLEGSGSCWYLA